MRLASILLSAIIVSCFSIQAQVDILGPNMNMPEPLSSKPNMDMPEPNPKPPIVPNKNSNQTINLIGNISSSKTQMTQIQQEVKPLDVSGKWSIKLNDSTDSSLYLNIWTSSGTKIMGFGTLTEGSIKNPITASGSVGEQELTLTTKSAVPGYDREYELHLFMINNTLSGTYVLKSGGQSLGKGNATAIKQ